MLVNVSMKDVMVFDRDLILDGEFQTPRLAEIVAAITAIDFVGHEIGQLGDVIQIHLADTIQLGRLCGWMSGRWQAATGFRRLSATTVTRSSQPVPAGRMAAADEDFSVADGNAGRRPRRIQS